MTQLNTKLVHGLPLGTDTTGAVNPPIYNSSTYAFETVESMPRWDYARSGNPTREFLERQIAQLEHGTRGFAFASGLAAIHAVLSIFAPNDRIVVGANIYGGTYSLFNEHFRRWGLLSTPVDTQDESALERAVRGDDLTPPARAVYVETLTNPLLQVNDIAAIARIAHRYGAIVIVDNTFVTPYLQQPLDLGADIVLHSATKYLAGHSDVIAGLAVVRDDALGERVYYAQNRLGGVLAPAECDTVRRGIQTLALRLERQQENALAVAQHLLAHPYVRDVHYPGIHGEPVAAKGLRGCGGVLSFEVAPGIDPADVLDHLRVFRLAVSLLLGGAETSVFTSSFSILIALAMAVLLLLPVLAVGWIFSRRIDAYVRQLQEARDADRDSYEKQRNLLISDMAHDLRTPVMSISAMAQALADDMVSPESRQEYYRGIISKSGKMGELITLLLDYVKLDSQGFALQREKTDLTRLVLEETADFYPAAEEAGMEVDADIPEEACMIEADIAFSEDTRSFGLAVRVFSDVIEAFLTLKFHDYPSCQKLHLIL